MFLLDEEQERYAREFAKNWISNNLVEDENGSIILEDVLSALHTDCSVKNITIQFLFSLFLVKNITIYCLFSHDCDF